MFLLLQSLHIHLMIYVLLLILPILKVRFASDNETFSSEKSDTDSVHSSIADDITRIPSEQLSSDDTFTSESPKGKSQVEVRLYCEINSNYFHLLQT